MPIRLEAALGTAGVSCRPPVDPTLPYSACILVGGGLGIAIADATTAAHFNGGGVVFGPLLSSTLSEIAMVLPAHQPSSKAVNEFIGITKALLNAGFPPA